VVLAVAPVDLPLHFPGLLVEWVLRVSKDSAAGPPVEEVFTDSSFVESSLLVEQGIFEVVSVTEVLPDSIFVVLVVLVSQSLLVVALVGQVDLGLATVDNAFRSFVVRALLVLDRSLQVLGLAEVLLDSEFVQFGVLVSERLLVDFRVLEFLGSEGLGLEHGSLVRSQDGEFLGISGLAVLASQEFSRDGSDWGLGGLRSRGSRGGLGRQGSLGSSRRLGEKSRSRFTSLEVLVVFPGFNVEFLDVTSIESREEFTSLEVVVVNDFTGLDFIPSLSSEGNSESGSTEDGDSKESDFGRHDDLVIKSFLRTCVELKNEVKLVQRTCR